MKKLLKIGAFASIIAAALVLGFASCEADMKTEYPAMCTVTYDGNGAEPDFYTMISVKSGDYLSIPEVKLTKTGYDFAGWYIDDAKADSETKITKNTTVTARWSLHDYTITYAGLEDAENPNTVATYTIESEDITLLDASKTGCTFSGWKNGGVFLTKIVKGSTGDITLTAAWDIIKLKVRFDADNGTDITETEVDGTIKSVGERKAYGINLKDISFFARYTYDGNIPFAGVINTSKQIDDAAEFIKFLFDGYYKK